MSNLDLSGYDLSHARLDRSDLSGTILSYTKLHHASLEKSILDECEFLGSDLSYVNLNECRAIRCGFGGADLSHASIINSDLSNATLSRSKLVHTDLRASKLENSRLSETNLTGAIFTRTKLVESDLKHSDVAHTNFELAKILCPAKDSECFTAAFLQDMALPFLACHRMDDYDAISKQWHIEGGDLAELERAVLDWDHAEVATWICSEWELPENLALAIKNHHNPASDNDPNTLAPVRLVSILREDESNDGVDELIAKAEDRYNIQSEKMESIINTSFEKAKELARVIA